jgi:hypothetical protein
MTKTTKPAAEVTTEVVTATIPAETQPRTLRLVGPTIPTLAQASVHIRRGYVFDNRMPLDVFAPTGSVAINLVLGTPEAHHVAAAEAATAEAMEIEVYQHQKEVEAAAARLLAERDKAAARAVIEQDIEKQKAAIEALQARLRATEASV